MTISYLHQDNLHFKPVSAYLLRGLLWVNVTLEKDNLDHTWQGKAICILSKTVFLGGAVVGIPLAIIEEVASGVIGLLGASLNYGLAEDGSLCLQKYSVKLLSYSIHSTLILISFIVLGIAHLNLFTVEAHIGQEHYEIPIPWKHYTPLAVGDHLLHLGSAATAQLVFGSVLDIAAGREFDGIHRVINLFRDGHPYMLNDVLEQIQTDFDLNILERMRAFSGELHTQFRNRLGEEFNFWELLSNEEYRERVLVEIQEVLHQAGVIEQLREGQDLFRFELNHFSVEEKAYQEHLQGLVKETLNTVCRDSQLYGLLDRNGTSGRDLILMCDADTYLPIATYTQYLEVSQELVCPQEFGPDLARYRERYVQLQAAQRVVSGLSVSEKTELVKKIFRGGDHDAQANVQACYLAISQLAVALHDGESPLMTKRAIDLRGGDGDLIATTSLFQEAYRQAAEGIDPEEGTQ